MIPRRTLGLMAGALVVLVGLSVFTSKQRYSTVKGGGIASLSETKIDPAQIQSIKAWLGDQPDSSVVLERAGDGWQVASRWGWAAKSDLVQQLLDDLAGLKGEKRSSDEKVLADYQIDDAKGLHVVGTSSGGTEMFHFVAGKTAAAGGSFVRRAGSNDVVLTRSSLRSTFGAWGDAPKVPDPKRWIDLQIHKAERNDVDKITLTSGKDVIVLEKEFTMTMAPPPAPIDTSAAGADSGKAAEAPVPTIDRTNWTWKKDAKGEFDKNKGDGILGTLCSLYAAEVSDPGNLATYGLGEGAKVAEVTTAEGKTTRIEFGMKTPDDKKVYVRVGEGLPAEIYTSSVDRIFPARKELSPDKK